MEGFFYLQKADKVKEAVEWFKRRTLGEWSKHFHAPEGFGWCDNDGLVEDDAVPVGVIPAYSFYQTYWLLADHDSPFEFDWSRYDFDYSVNYHFLESVIPVLDAQLEMWAADKETLESKLFLYFSYFVFCLKELSVQTWRYIDGQRYLYRDVQLEKKV